MTNATLRGKSDAGNPHVRFDEGEVAPAKPRRGSLLYIKIRYGVVLLAISLVAASTFAGSNIIYSGARLGTTRDAATVVAAGRTLSDFSPKCAFLQTNAAVNVVGPCGTAWAAFTKTVTADAELSTQFQLYHQDLRSGWTYTSALVVRFFQDGSDIRAYLKAAYVSNPFEYLLGKDIEALAAAGDPRVQAAALATDSAEGYGITHLILTAAVTSETVQSTYGELTNGVTVAAGKRLVLDNYARFEYDVPGKEIASNVVVEGELAFKNFRGTFSGAVSGSGDITIKNNQAHVEKVYYDGFIPCDTTWANASKIVVAKNHKAGDIVEVSGRLYYSSGGNYTFMSCRDPAQTNNDVFRLEGDVSSGNDKRIVGTQIFFDNKGTDLRALLVKNPRSVYYRSKTNANIIAVCGTGGPFLGMDMWDTRLVSGVDYSNLTAVSAETSTKGRYGWLNLTITFKDGTTTTVDLSGNLEMTVGGVIRAEGVEANSVNVAVSGLNSVPAFGRVEAGAHSSLKGAVVNSRYADDDGQWVVWTNGFLQSWGNVTTEHLPPVNVLGGTFKVSGHRDQYVGQSGRTQSAQAYLNRLVLSDGGVVTSSLPFFVGYRHDKVTSCVWKVTGKTPSFVRGSFGIVGSKAYETRRFALSVDDVTGDDSADLTIAGGILRYNDVVNDNLTDNMSLVKIGEGTAFLQGRLHTAKPTYIGEGVMKLGNCVVERDESYPQNIVLDGGSLAVAANTTNELGTLTVAAKTGKIILESGAELSFANSSAAVWTAGAEIEITGDLEASKLRFGTGSGGLTIAQKRCLRYNGDRISLDPQGYAYKRNGLTLLIR